MFQVKKSCNTVRRETIQTAEEKYEQFDPLEESDLNPDIEVIQNCLEMFQVKKSCNAEKGKTIQSLQKIHEVNDI